MKGIIRQLVIILALFVNVNFLLAQRVSQVSVKQEDNVVKIFYHLDRPADISVYVSTDGGRSFTILNKVSGDVGKTVGPGNKMIVWDVLAEMDKLVGDDIQFKVRVDCNAEYRWKTIQRKRLCTFFTVDVSYSFLPQWAYGFTIGQSRIVGWFVTFESNFNFKGIYHPFEANSTYELLDNRTIRLSAQAGLVVRPCRPVAMLFGVGYGYRTLTYKTSDDEWFAYPKRTFQGIDASFGLLFDIKGFALSAEAVTTNFKTIEVRAGIGFCIPHKLSKS